MTALKNTFILIDTSAWVAFLTTQTGVLGTMAALAVERDQAAICGVVIAELLQGAKGEMQQRQFDEIFSFVETLPMTESVMKQAGLMLQKLRQQGIVVPLTDAVIAAVALEQGVPLLTADKNFQHFEGLTIMGINE